MAILLGWFNGDGSQFSPTNIPSPPRNQVQQGPRASTPFVKNLVNGNLKRPQPQQQPQPPRPAPQFHLFNNPLTRGVENAVNQINPFDNGRTWQNPQGSPHPPAPAPVPPQLNFNQPHPPQPIQRPQPVLQHPPTPQTPVSIGSFHVQPQPPKPGPQSALTPWNLVQGIAKPGTDLVKTDIVNPIRQEAAMLTHNPVALHNAEASQTQNLLNLQQYAQAIFTRPAAETAATVLHPGDTSYHPNSPIEQAVFGKTPIKNIQSIVHDTQKTNGNLAGAAIGLGHVIQDLPDVGLVAKGIKSGVKATTPVIKAANDIKVPLNQVGAVGKNVSRSQIQKNLTDAIKNGSNKPVYFGELSPSKLNQINAIRTANGIPPLDGTSVHVYPNVIKKLQDKRVNIDGLTPNKVADIAHSAIHNSSSKVVGTQYPQIQASIKAKDNLANIAFIGKSPSGGASLKSTYPLQPSGIKRAIGQKNTPTKLASQEGGAFRGGNNDSPSGRPDGLAQGNRQDIRAERNQSANTSSIPQQGLNVKPLNEDGGINNPVTPPNEQFPVPTVPAKKGVILQETRPSNPQTPIIQKVFKGKNPDGTPNVVTQEVPRIAPKSAAPQVRDPNLDRALQNTLKTATPEEAIQQHMDSTGSSLQQSAKYVSTLAKESGIDIGQKDIAKNPLLGSPSVPKVSAGDFGQAHNNASFVHDQEKTVGQNALDSYDKLSSNDQVRLKQIETSTVAKVAQKADNPQAFQQAAKDIRTYYDTRHAYDHLLGINTGYRSNYLRQVFDKAQADFPDEQISLKSGNRNPAYTKERSNETLGANVRNALEKDINQASYNHAKLAYEQGLNEAFPGKIASGEAVRTTEDGVYKQLNHKYGAELFAPKDIAHQINSRTFTQNASKALNRYDTVNHALKYTKLAGGLFHAFTELLNFGGQQLGSGKLITDPKATGRLFKVFFHPKTMDRELARMSDKGVLDNAGLAGLTTRPKDILADANVKIFDKGKNAVTKYTGLQAMHDATFQREIPYAKLKIFEQQTEGLDPNKPADLAKMRETARAINNAFGGINRNLNGIKPSTFMWLQRVLLATDFTEGKWHTMWDAISHGGPAGKIARQTVIGKAVIAAALVTGLGAAFGDYKGQSGKQIAKEAGGNLLDPQFKAGGYTVKPPKTHISEFVDALKPTKQNKGAPWNGSGLISYAGARTAALPSEAIQLLSNKDYYGQPIYGKNTKKNGGGPISPGKTALNILNTVAPIPFGQGVKTASKQQNVAAALANVAGFNVKPTPVSKGGTNNPTGSKTGSLKQQTQSGAKQPTPGIYQVKGKGGAVKYATLNGPNLKTYNSLSDAKAAQAKNEFKYSNKTTTTINGQAYHKSASGRILKGSASVTSGNGSGPSIPKASKTAYDPKTKTWTQTSSTGKVTQIAPDGTRTVMSPGLGSIKNARPDYVANIRSLADKYNVDPNAALAVAATEGLGGGVGDGGTSYGPFQLHQGGALPPGATQVWAESPAGIDYAMQRIAQVAGGLKGQQAINAIVQGFEKPADPNSEVANASSIYSGRGATLSPGSTRSATLASSNGSGAGYYTSSGYVKAPRARSTTVRTARAPKATKATYKTASAKLPKTPKLKVAKFKTPKQVAFKAPKLRSASIPTGKVKTPRLKKLA